MNKYLKVFFYFLGFILILWTVGRMTNTFQYFHTPTSSNEPTIKKGSRFFASNLIKPKRFDHICFYAINQNLNEEASDPVKEIWVHRLCGITGDIVEIRKGDLFVNNESVDKKIRIENMYRLPTDEYERIKDSITIDEWMIPDDITDSVSLPFEKDFIIKHKIKAIREVVPATRENEFITARFSKPWNEDNFGPIKVPADKYFVLGDNRHNAQDSRYIGFVDKKDYVATVLWK